jgi:superfamily II DNA or RNA helicase
VLQLGSELTFLPDRLPSESTFAAWAGDSRNGHLDHVELVLPRGATGQPRRTRVPATLVPLREAVPVLASLPADAPASASQHGWSTAVKLAVDLVARGRLQPGQTTSGVAAWRVGPLDVADEERLAALAAALPVGAHAVPIPGSRPLCIRSARFLIGELLDAVADALVRTSAAPATGAPAAFAERTPTDVADTPALGVWLDQIGRPEGGGAIAGVRLDLSESRSNGRAASIDSATHGETDDVAGGAEGATSFRAILQLRSRVDPSLIVDAAELWTAPGPVLSRLGDDAEADVLLSLRRARAVWPPAERLLAEAAPDRIELDDTEVSDLLGPAADALASLGFEVLWPSDLGFDRVQLRAVLSTPAPAAVTEAGLSFETLAEFRWEAALGGMQLTEAELRQLATAKRPLVRLRGKWVLADPQLLERLRRRPPPLDPMAALAATLTGELTVDGEQVDVVAEGALDELAGRLRNSSTDGDGSRELEEPQGLKASLRPYQRRGLAWLAGMAELGIGGCLADDMGLGKTVQLIALHLHRRRFGQPAPTLVVCPASLLGNWEHEIERFAPDVSVRRYHGGDRHLDGLADDEIVLVTYGLVRRDRAELAEVGWGLVVADEAQHVKNPLARTAKELRRIPAQARLALTGTPVENRLTELWAILDWTTPGLLGPLERFRREVAVPVERHRDPEATERLARVVRPFLLRRRKSDPGIAPELPPKTTTDEFVPLTSEQATLYQAVLDESLDKIANSEGIDRRGLVLQMLTSLKQICNHPAQYLHEKSPLPGRSGKLAALDELLDSLLDAGESVLVFSQYVQMAGLVEQHLADRGVDTLFLSGRVPARRRDEMVVRFQDGACPVFLLSLKAGGTGLNLTRATHVVHYDRWWNPAVEDQASDRAWRIGQDRPVQIHRLVTEGTLEERIAKLLETKRVLAEAVVGSGEGWLTELSDDELAELVSLGRGA